MSTLNTVRSQGLVSSQPSSVGKIARRIALGLARILVLLFSLLLCVPVILLPFTTSVPAWVSIVLAVADVALFLLHFRFALASRETLGVTGGILLVSLIAGIASQVFAATPPIRDANGQPIPNSISSLDKVTINGT